MFLAKVTNGTLFWTALKSWRGSDLIVRWTQGKDGTYRFPERTLHLTREFATEAIDGGADCGIRRVECHVEDIGVVVYVCLRYGAALRTKLARNQTPCTRRTLTYPPSEVYVGSTLTR